MNRKHILFAVVGVASFALLTGFGSAAAHHMPFGHDSAKAVKFINWKVNDTLDDLKATDAQRAKVVAVKDHLVAEGQKLHAQSEQVHDQIAQQWTSEHMNVPELKARADQQLNELRAFLYQGIDGMAQIHDTLTPAQRAQLADDIRRAHGSH